MEFTLIGYFPKKLRRPPDWLPDLAVALVASVSECISPGPDDWINQWKHNEMWLFDNEQTAIGIVPPEERSEYSMMAYSMLPELVEEGRHVAFEIPQLQVAPMSKEYIRLGYDAVDRATRTNFGCSPLSCNLRAYDYPVNKYCLVDTVQEAVEIANSFSQGNAEPGPYVVIEVWLKGTPNQAL